MDSHIDRARAMASDASTSREVLDQLARSQYAGIRALVAKNPSMDGALLEELARDSSLYVRKMAARNPNLPAGNLVEFAQSDNKDIRRAVAGNPAAPVEILQVLARDESRDVRADAAGNPSLPAALLRELSIDRKGKVRRAVAGNPSTPVEVLAGFIDDKAPTVREYLEKNPSTPKWILDRMDEIRELATFRASERARRAGKARPDFDVDPEWARRIKYWGYAKMYAVSTDPDSPPDALRAIAKHVASLFRAEVAKNPACPQDVLAWLATDSNRHVRSAAKSNSNYDHYLSECWRANQSMVRYCPDRERVICYGLNDEGARRIVENWQAPDSCTVAVPISPDEFDCLWDSGIIDDLNEHYRVLIDDYEVDAIGGDLSYALNCVEPKAEALPNVYVAIKAAHDLGTAVLFCF